MNNKYGAEPQTFEGILFDSRWELEVYKFIRRYIPSSHIKLKAKIAIKPKTKNYKAKYWRCDFVILGRENNEILLIEAKGVPTRDFKRQLQLIDCNYPHLIDRIRIVQHQSTRIDERFKSVTLHDLIPELKVVSFHINYKPKEEEEEEEDCYINGNCDTP